MGDHRESLCASTAVAIGRAIARCDRLIRIHFLGFSVLWPLMGALTVDSRLQWTTAAGLVGVACCFHIFGILLNDVIDLPVDRGNPLRSDDPLVRGEIRPRQALAAAVATIPAAVLFAAWLGAGWRAYVSLAVAYAGMTAYNLWGKHCPIPPITDGVQGVAWGALTFFGALSVSGRTTELTWIVVGYAMGYFLLINGVHGGLRDLKSDRASGRSTTAIFLGIRAAPGGRLTVTPLAWVYCVAVLTFLIVLTAVPYFTLEPDQDRSLSFTGPAVLILLHGLNIFLMAQILLTTGAVLDASLRLHVFTLIVSLILTLSGFVEPYATVLLLAVFLTPVAPLQVTRTVLRRCFLKEPKVPARMRRSAVAEDPDTI